MRMQIKEFADFTGVSVRTLHYYDEIGLMKPAQVDHINGYRYYDEQSLLRMQEILFYRELDFSLKSIGDMLSSPDYDRQRALEEQKKLLILKKERLEKLILAIDGAAKGENVMTAFDNHAFEKYKEEARQKWGQTVAYKEHEEKTRDYSNQKWSSLAEGLDRIMAEFSLCMQRGEMPDSVEARHLVKVLQGHITDNYYTCTDQILLGLGQMYVGDERFRTNIDQHGDGTARFICNAIEAYCKK